MNEQDDALTAAAAEVERAAIKVGRTQMAVEIMRVLHSRDSSSVSGLVAVIALCNKESQ